MTCLVLVLRQLLCSLLLELHFHHQKNNMYSMPCTAFEVQYLFLTFQYLKYIKFASYSFPKYLLRFFRTSCLSLSLSLIVPTEIMFRLTFKTHCFQPSGVLEQVRHASVNSYPTPNSRMLESGKQRKRKQGTGNNKKNGNNICLKPQSFHSEIKILSRELEIF